MVCVIGQKKNEKWILAGMASQTVQSVHYGNKCLEQRECQLLNVMSSSWRIRGPGSIRYDRSKWSPGSHLTMGKMPMASAGVSEMLSSVQSLSHVWICDPMDCSMPGLPVHHQLPEFTQTHVHWVGDAIQPSHPLSSPSPPAFNLSQHRSLFQWVSSSQQVVKVLEFQLQHQSFQWTLRTDLL